MNLDVEFKRYTQILRSYLQQIADKNIPEICNAWIARLSACEDDEKALRNKYVFTLCYQLARGTLDDPFLKCPSDEKLKPFSENDSLTEDSSTDLECVVVNFESKCTQSKKDDPHSDTDQLSQEGTLSCRKDSCEMTNCERIEESHNEDIFKESFMNYDCPVMKSEPAESTATHYEYRASNLIMKLRDIKKQNLLLQEELRALKEEAKFKPEDTSSMKMNNSGFMRDESLKWKLKEMQESRTNLIEAISTLQDNLEHFEELKQQEIEDLKARQKLEIIKTKSAVREEVKELHEKNLEALKEKHEHELLKVKSDAEKEIREMTNAKDKIILERDSQIQRLQNQVDELRNNLQSTLNRLLEKSSSENGSENEFYKIKTQQLEKKLERMEKIKQKCVRVYEAKIAMLQREKHLNECSLQLQLVRQRAQVVNDTSAENQTELNNALDKLETKYKEIVANIQATAIQRRIQDQMALESILQTASSLAQPENVFQTNYSLPTTVNRPKAARNQNIETNHSYDTEISSMLRGGKDCNPVNCPVGNKSFGEESVMAGYCLDSERLGELFERVYIPQRDTGDGPPNRNG